MRILLHTNSPDLDELASLGKARLGRTSPTTASRSSDLDELASLGKARRGGRAAINVGGETSMNSPPWGRRDSRRAVRGRRRSGHLDELASLGKARRWRCAARGSAGRHLDELASLGKARPMNIASS